MPPTLELSMIVRNGAASLDRCLASAAGTVDRILIGDTGSTDRTSEVATRHGAELIPIPWNDDFAEARNQVLSRAVCDWILVLDADEMLAPEARAALPALIRDPSAWTYDLWRWNYVQDLGYRSGGEQALVNPGHLEAARRYPAYFRTDHTRLFRRDPRIRFEHCVHESVVESLDAAHLPRRRAGIVIHHFGYVDDAEQIRGSKYKLYHRLVRRKLAQAPHSYQAHLEAGIAELDYAKKPATALPHFTRASELAPTMQAVWLYRGVCLTRLARYAG